MTVRPALIATAVVALALAACGQKSGLYLPDDAPEEVALTPEGLRSAAEAAAASAAPAAPAVPAAEPAPRDDEDTRPNN